MSETLIASGQQNDPTEERAKRLMRRAPSGYLWNQAYSFWQFLSLLLFTTLIARLLGSSVFGVYQIALTASSTAIYIAALGLESSGAVYLPRVLAEHGPGAAMAVALRLLAIRLAMLLLMTVGLLWGLPELAHIAAVAGLPGAQGLAQALASPAILDHRGALALYIAATSLSALLSTLLTALLRTRVIFIAGSLAQLVTLGLTYLFSQVYHAGADGALNALAIPTAVTGLIYLVALLRVIGASPRQIGQHVTGPMLRLGLAAWASDLASGSLLKTIAVAQLGVFAISYAAFTSQSASFGITYEMGHAAALLFIAGLGGVGLAVMSVSYASSDQDSLAVAWRTVSKLQIVLGVPLVAFCIPHAGAIMPMLYGNQFANTGGLLALFLVFNGLVRLAGGGAHSAALYVLGRQRWVVLTSWGMLGVLAVCDIVFIPRYGVAGALLAVGVAQLAQELAQLALARRFMARPYPVSFIVRILVAMAPATLFAVIWRPTSFVELFLAGLGYLLLFVVALRLIRPLDAEDRTLLGETSPLMRKLLLPFTQPPTLLAPEIVPTSTPTKAATVGGPSPVMSSVSRPLASEAER